MKKLNFSILLIALALVVLPFSAGASVSSTNYIIDPEASIDNPHHNVSSTNYALEGSLDPISASRSSTNYSIEGGDAYRYYCGDGFIDPSESCDGNDNLGGATCVSQGFVSGTLTCSSSCAYVTSACTAAGGGGGGGGGSTVSSAPSAPSVSADVPSDFVYSSSLFLNGAKGSDATSVKVNTSETGVTYPTSTTWKVTISLAFGLNTFSLKASNTSGDSSATVFDVYRRLIGDITQDNTVNDYDLSKLVALWGSSNRGGDFNEDKTVDDYDFSMMVARWGTNV
jgi:hypothetical protein